MWQTIDLNGDGEISQIEFIKALRRDRQLGAGVLCDDDDEDTLGERAPFALLAAAWRVSVGLPPCDENPLLFLPLLCDVPSARNLGLPNEIHQEDESRAL